MKVFFDHQIFTNQVFGGISRYFCELLLNIDSCPNVDFELPLVYSRNKYLEDLQLNEKIKFHPLCFKGGARLGIFINKLINIHRIKKGDYDILHPTYYDTYFLKHMKDNPFVLTVYDMIHEKLPQFFSYQDPTSENKKTLAKAATKIIAISHSTKKDLIDIWGIPENKIEVIYLASSFSSTSLTSLKASSNNLGKYVLYVGGRDTYKNFTLFFDAFAQIALQHRNLNLICVGGGNFSNSELAQISKYDLIHRVSRIDAKEAELIQLYKEASFFIFPSLYEGFGLPALESLSLGCPTLLSKLSSLPEVGGDAAIYFDPNHKQDIIDAINHVLSPEFDKELFLYKAKQQVQKFSWEVTTNKTIKVYKDCIISKIN